MLENGQWLGKAFWDCCIGGCALPPQMKGNLAAGHAIKSSTRDWTPAHNGDCEQDETVHRVPTGAPHQRPYQVRQSEAER